MSLKNLSKTLATATKNPPQGTRSLLSLDSIKPRPHGDTRPTNPAHVDALAQSVEAVGLIQPIAVDREGFLIAGGHRLAALRSLQQSNSQRFTELFPDGVPVFRIDISAKDAPSEAIALEAAENEQRRDYTPSEVRELADRLVAAGYRYGEGKPRKGEKALIPALSVIVGKSHRTIQRHLNPKENQTGATISPWTKRAAQLRKWHGEATSPELKDAIARVLELLE